MGLAWGQGGGGLQARVREVKLSKSQSMANPALSRALMGQKRGGAMGEQSRQLPSAARSLVLRPAQDP